jgi:hypothetical protein
MAFSTGILGWPLGECDRPLVEYANSYEGKIQWIPHTTLLCLVFPHPLTLSYVLYGNSGSYRTNYVLTRSRFFLDRFNKSSEEALIQSTIVSLIGNP